MKANNPTEAKNNDLQDAIIERALKTCGYLLPETIEEVIAFEKIFGNTDFDLPEALKKPKFLDLNSQPLANNNIKYLSKNDNMALAAREAKEGLSEEIQKRMEKDRKEYLAKKRNFS